MNAVIYDFLPIFFLIALGAILGKSGFFTSEMVGGLKKIVASIALPALLFGAFARIHVDAGLGLLALVIYLACAVMGGIGTVVGRVARLPSPATTFLFQGFEAGMLGYGLFIALFGADSLRHFATADLGQVVFVFTALLAQLKRAEAGAPVSPLGLLRNMLLSPVIIAIVAGLLASIVFPDAQGAPWAEHGALAPLLSTLGALTTPLVCLVVGFGLKDFHPGGAGRALVFVLVRLAVALALGSLVAFGVVGALGFPPIQAIAVLFLFILPPPFIIPVFRTAQDDARFIGSVLSLHTIASIVTAVVIAALAG